MKFMREFLCRQQGTPQMVEHVTMTPPLGSQDGKEGAGWDDSRSERWPAVAAGLERDTVAPGLGAERACSVKGRGVYVGEGW